MLCAILMGTAFMYSCGNGGSVEESSAVSENTVSEDTVSGPDNSEDVSKPTAEHASGVLVVDNIAELRELNVDSEDLTVSLLGYYEPGDGGQGIFFWSDKSATPDNGGTVIKCANEKGRFIRLCEDCERNVLWFGAKGDGKTDDSDAIQAAVDSLPARGGTVRIPGGTYVVSKTINIGNGNAENNWSTKHGVALVGNGSGQGVHSAAVPTTIIASSGMDNVISVNGLISDVVIKGLYVSGNLKAKNGVFLHAFCGLRMSDVRITQFTEKGLYILAGKAPTGNYNIYNRFENVNVTTGHDGAECLYMDGTYDASNDTWLSTFTQCVFDTLNGNGSNAAHFKFVDSISFYSCRFTAGEQSTGILFDALDNNDFPSGIGFYSCSVSSTEVLEDNDHLIRKEYFYGFSTVNGEIIPTHNKLIGITDTGTPFNMDGVIQGGGSSSGLPAKKGLVDLYNNAQWVHYNLSSNKAAVGVRINCAGKLSGGRAYLANYDNKVGSVFIKVYKWDTDYDTTVSGEVLTEYDFINFNENTWLNFSFPKQLDPGEYLVVFTAATEAGDFGAGIWTQAKSLSVITYYNGNEVDFGVAASLDIK